MAAQGMLRGYECRLISCVVAEPAQDALRQIASISQASPQRVIIMHFHVRRITNNPRMGHQV
eukprot:475621-Pyramimonas_sp.AAC.1